MIQLPIRMTPIIAPGFYSLFAEDLLYVADFSLHFSGDLFRSATVSQISVSSGLTRFLFDFPTASFAVPLTLSSVLEFMPGYRLSSCLRSYFFSIPLATYAFDIPGSAAQSLRFLTEQTHNIPPRSW